MRFRIAATLLALLASSGTQAAAISAKNRPAYCRGEVSGMYGTRPLYVKTARPVKEHGGQAIYGTVDKGREGIKKFKCRFDAHGNFVDVMALTPDGE